MTTQPLPPAIRVISGSERLGSLGPAGPDPLADVIDLGLSTSPPSPQAFVVESYIPAGCVTSLYAKGGSSKSFVALMIAFAIVRGEPIFGRDVEQGSVLYLDAELDDQTAQRRAWMIANGLGIKAPPRGLYYHRLVDSLTDERCNSAVRKMLDVIRPRLTIVDSFTAAIRGKDTNMLDDVSDRLRWLAGLGTVLVIDHTPKGADIGAGASAIGSVAKSIFARSCLFIASNGKASLLRHDKSNFGQLVEPIRFALNFSSQFVTLEAPLASDDSRLHGIEGALPARDRVRDALASGEYPEGVTSGELSALLGINQNTVQNALGDLKREGVARRDGKKWLFVG